MSTQMIERMAEYCEEKGLFSARERVLAGVSGGADSVLLICMLGQLAPRWELELRLVHVNHGIRGEEAGRDEQFCRKLAEKLGLPITVFQGDVPALAAKKGMSEEEAGRCYRYQCMEEERRRLGYDKIAVAHHRDDQAETTLFQLLRGSSLRGLGGMHPIRGRIVRPLLPFCREEIEGELRRRGQDWCEDSTNREMLYARNKLRHRVLPYIEREVAPGAAVHLARLADQMQELSDYLGQETHRLSEELVRQGDGRLEVEAAAFCRLHPVVQRELVMEMLERTAGSRKDITGRHVQAVCALAAGSTGKRLCLPYGMQAGRDYEMLWLAGKTADAGRHRQYRQELPPSGYLWQQPEQGPREYWLEDSFGRPGRIVLEKKTGIRILGQNTPKEIKNDCTKWFDYARINGMLEFRHPQEGDFFVLDRKGNRKRLSRFLIDCKIPQERRRSLWVLAMGAHILWVPELGRISAGFYVTETTEEVLCASYHRMPGPDREIRKEERQ